MPSLSRHPEDVVAVRLLRVAQDGGTLFAAVYLILHGLVKVVLVVALLRDQLTVREYARERGHRR